MASEGAIIPQLVESLTQSSSPSPAICSVPMAGGDISSSAHTTIPCLTEIVLDEKTKKELFTDTFCRVCGAVLQFESHKNAHYEGKKHAQRVRLYFLKQELEEMTYKKQKSDRVASQTDQCFSQDKNRFCSLCNMVFSSPVVAQSHYVGKIHAKKLKLMSVEQNLWLPEANDVSSNPHKETAAPPVSEPSSVAPPLSEKSHQQEVSAEQTSSSAADNEVDLSDPDKYCKLCCASFNKPLVAQQHYNGKKHARNEARRRMMEEMEDMEEAVDSEALGEGNYTCPICSVTLTSIEMYQSHMQGNKHQIKKNMVANMMNSSKTFGSFQDELEDYIKVQRARGLEPKTMLRQERDHGDSSEDPDPVPAPVHPIANPYKHFPPRPMSYPLYRSPHPADPRVAGWESGCWPQNPMVRQPGRPLPYRKRPASSPESSDYSSSSSSSSDESSGSYKRTKRHRREHRHKDGKHHSKVRRENESSEHKKRKPEEAISGKDNSDKEKKGEESPVDKAKHRRDKKKREEPPADKDIKKHKKAKKPADQKTEEELLWDESILGF